MVEVTLPKVGTDRAWREAARACLAARLPPDLVRWGRGGIEADLFSGGGAPPPVQAGGIKVPESFVALAGQVVWHRDPERFARLYAMLWRLRTTPGLMADAADPGLVRLRAMEKAVARDLHKTRAFVRFREIGRAAPRREFGAWFEPAQLTLEPAAPFFARRFGDMDWTIATPDLVASFRDGALAFHEGAERPELPEDAAEGLWLTYFRNIFNPARVKVKAMTAEMPKKYWANLPETAAIPDLLAQAERRVREMAAAAPTLPSPTAEALARRPAAPKAPARPVRGAASPAPAAPTGHLAALREEEAACTRCPLHLHATQVVPGEGPAEAPLMMVGEQPGDQEDIAGRPFVGPAGQLLDRLMGQAGIDRQGVFMTNAVKHFKFTLKGVRRIHQSPATGEIRACRWWVEQEVGLVKPKLIVGLGATAAEALTGTRAGILKRRGTIEAGPDGIPVFLTVHPSFLLRLPDPVAQEMETERLREDLSAAKAELERLMAA